MGGGFASDTNSNFGDDRGLPPECVCVLFQLGITYYFYLISTTKNFEFQAEVRLLPDFVADKMISILEM